MKPSKTVRPLLALLLTAALLVLGACEWLQNEFVYIRDSGSNLQEQLDQLEDY